MTCSMRRFVSSLEAAMIQHPPRPQNLLNVDSSRPLLSRPDASVMLHCRIHIESALLCPQISFATGTISAFCVLIDGHGISPPGALTPRSKAQNLQAALYRRASVAQEGAQRRGWHRAAHVPRREGQVVASVLRSPICRPGSVSLETLSRGLNLRRVTVGCKSGHSSEPHP